jgi:sarcosine oxidase subunit delta
MLLIVCPYCGKRPEIEFAYGGQAHLARPLRPAELDDGAWAEFLYMRANTKGVYAERWRHSRGCGRFFNALRDTSTDHFLAFYKTGAPLPTLTASADHTDRVAATDHLNKPASEDRSGRPAPPASNERSP